VRAPHKRCCHCTAFEREVVLALDHDECLLLNPALAPLINSRSLPNFVAGTVSPGRFPLSWHPTTRCRTLRPEARRVMTMTAPSHL
jgi:hypothetical protein